MSYNEIDVFISNYTLVDPEVYQLWVEGYSTSEAVATLESREIMKQTGATIDLVESDVLDHYRTYNLLEKLLQNPLKLAEQVSFQIEPQTQQLLIEKYYEFDDSVIRELLGKKLSSRHRKDLDEVSEKTSVLLKSCRRQFDNVKRVFKTVEELTGNIVQNIKSNFLLSDELSRKYAAIVFIAGVRFETSKRKLQYLTFSDFYHCATAIMNKWMYRDASAEFDLDREFLLDLRDVRILLDKEREHKHLVCQRLKPSLLERSYQELENNFRSYSRALVGLACNIHRSRELKSLFVELVERCIEPWRQVSWSHADLKNFLSAYEHCALEMDILRMNGSTIAEQEDLIKESLFTLVKKHIPTAEFSDIDEIILSYVVSILEDLASEIDVQDAFDVEGFCEMLSAYLPEFVNIDHGLVCEWIFQLSSTLSQKKFRDDSELDRELPEISLNRLNLSGSLSSSGRSRHSSSECSISESNVDLKKRTHLLSETSDASSDSSGDFSGQEDSFLCSEVQMLQEMFPSSSLMEVKHCLAVAEGDVERATQIVLHRQEAGQSLSSNVNLLQPINQRQRPIVNDEELKSRIIARYSYVDKNDDIREHRPVAPKSEPKKLVRYRDNKIVSLKGERYTEVKKEEGEEHSAKILKQSKTKAH